MSQDLRADILDLLPKLEGESHLRHLYCELLNYEYTDIPIPPRDWSTLAREVTEDGRVIAKRGGFYVVFLKIKKLTMTNERSVLNEVLKRYPECVVIFYGVEEGLWHIVSPRFDPEMPHKFLIRRYVIGPHERLRTASERISLTYTVDEDSTARIKEKHDDAFNVEAVTKEFFETYKEVLSAVKNDLVKQRKTVEQTAHAFTQQLLNRLMFLYFVQKKGWLNKDPCFIKNLWVKYEQLRSINDNFYEAWIEPLFFYSFNKKPIPPKYDLPKKFVEIYGKMPFLNGGLFTRNELDDVGLKVKDSHMRLIIEGLLERFNFTIREDLPFDVEVAVDPEMLGKVYESLVLEEERGKSGIFYTPRIEVDFMCRQAIIEYLVETTGIPYDTVISFVWAEPTAETPEVGREELRIIRDALWNVKIVDPACGSGAFLVGIMHVLFDFYRRIAAEFGEVVDEFEIKRRIIQENLFGVDIKPWAIRVAELRLWLTLIVDVDESKIDLYSKPLLPNLTFKLRVGDSLVQELAGKQLSVRAMYNRLPLGVRGALQELIQLKRDYYYNKGNTDISGRIREKEVEILGNIIKDRLNEIEVKLKTLAGVQQRFATAVSASKEEEGRNQEKQKLETEREELETTLNALKEARKFFWEIDFPEVFANGGFDIVIGNPPYVRQELIAPANLPLEKQTTEVRQNYKEKVAKSVEVHWGSDFRRDMKSDFYVYFFYHSFSLLKPGGTFCFITSNSWLDIAFGFEFQRFLLRNMEIKAVYDNLAKRTFAESDINTVISVFKRPASMATSLPYNIIKFVAFRRPYEEVLNRDIINKIYTSSLLEKTELYRCFPISQQKLWELGLVRKRERQESLTKDVFVGEYQGEKWGSMFLRAPDILFTILEKGTGKLARLDEMGYVRYPIKTGVNEFFYVDDEIVRKFGIEREFLIRVVKSPKEFSSIKLDKSNLTTLLFRCNISKKDLSKLGKHGAFSYIKWGEKQVTKLRQKTPEGVPWPKVPSVQGRKPDWYSIGEIDPADAFCNRFFDKRFFFGFSEIPVIEDQTFYGLTLNKDYKKEKDTQIALLNSTLSYLLVEIFGRVALGQGVLQYATYEMGRLLTLDSKKMPDNLRKRLVSAFRSVANREIKPIFEEVKMQDRREMDDILFDFIGLSKDERNEVYTALVQLVKGRLEKATSLSR